MRVAGLTPVKRGSAGMALPLLIFLAFAPALSADSYSNSQPVGGEGSHVDAGARMLLVKPAVLDNLSQGQGFPATGGTFLLWGGGATVVDKALRVGVSGWTGALDAASGSRDTHWGLNLASLNLEQRYSGGSFTFTGGASLELGQLEGVLSDFSAPGGVNRAESNLWGYSVTAGMRWPAQTRLGFFLRGGWQWLQGDGVWHGGNAANALGATHFDLGGPNVTGQIELSL